MECREGETPTRDYRSHERRGYLALDSSSSVASTPYLAVLKGSHGRIDRAENAYEGAA
jgi:hypothetical protein